MSHEVLQQIARLNAEAEDALARGLADQALSLTQQAYELGRGARLDRSPAFVTTLNNLGVLTQERGNHDEAKLLFEEAVATLRGPLKSEHPEAAHILHNLGN